MVLTKEELGQQVKDTYNKWIATWKTREEVIWAMKNQLQTTWQYDAAKQIATWIQTPEQAKQDGVNVLTPEQLKVKNNVVTQPEVINPPTLPIAEVKPTETPEIQAQDRSKYIDTKSGE